MGNFSAVRPRPLQRCWLVDEFQRFPGDRRTFYSGSFLNKSATPKVPKRFCPVTFSRGVRSETNVRLSKICTFSKRSLIELSQEAEYFTNSFVVDKQKSFVNYAMEEVSNCVVP